MFNGDLTKNLIHDSLTHFTKQAFFQFWAVRHYLAHKQALHSWWVKQVTRECTSDMGRGKESLQRSVIIFISTSPRWSEIQMYHSLKNLPFLPAPHTCISFHMLLWHDFLLHPKCIACLQARHYWITHSWDHCPELNKNNNQTIPLPHHW